MIVIFDDLESNNGKKATLKVVNWLLRNIYWLYTSLVSQELNTVN